MNDVIIWIFIIIVFLLIFKVLLNTYELYSSYLDHKTKCFDCEKDIIKRCGEEWAWTAQPAKSFDAEFDLVSRKGDPWDGYGAKTIKYY